MKKILKPIEPWGQPTYEELRKGWNARLIPKKLIELAKAGVYYDSKMI